MEYTGAVEIYKMYFPANQQLLKERNAKSTANTDIGESIKKINFKGIE